MYSKDLLYIVAAHTQTTKSRTKCMYMLCNYSYLLKKQVFVSKHGGSPHFFATYNNGIFMTIYDKALLHE